MSLVDEPSQLEKRTRDGFQHATARRTVRLDVGDESVDIRVEVLDADDATLTPVAKTPEDVVTSRVFNRAIRAVANRFREELMALSDPDELTLEFGASLKGGATVFLSGEGTFKVQLKWVKQKT